MLLSSQITSRKNEKLPEYAIKDKLGCEIADCLIALLSLANDFEIDISQYVNEKLKKHIKRSNGY